MKLNITRRRWIAWVVMICMQALAMFSAVVCVEVLLTWSVGSGVLLFLALAGLMAGAYGEQRLHEHLYGT